MIKTPVNAIFHEDSLALDSCLLTVSPHRLSLVCAHKVWRGEKSEVRERQGERALSDVSSYKDINPIVSGFHFYDLI